MSNLLTICREDLIQHIKLSCQIPTISKEIATRKIILQAAQQAGLTVELVELQQAADQLRIANKLLRSEDTWTWLRQYCLTLDELEILAYSNIISTKLAQHLFGDRVEQYFVTHQLDYAAAELYEIVLEDHDLATELFYAIGEADLSFPEAARQYITDPELRRVGGYRGKVLRSSLKPELSAAVFAATPPQLLEPMVINSGSTHQATHLIWVEELIQPQLDETLRLKILSDLYAAWIEQQLKQFEIVPQLDVETPSQINAQINQSNSKAPSLVV